MKAAAHASAVLAVCTGAAAWLPTIETALRVAGGLVALAAGVVSLLVHWRNYRREKQKR